MRYGILGPLSVSHDGQSVSHDGLSVSHDGQQVAITAGRDRIVLAILLLRPGRIVGVGELIEAVWSADPPATARGQLQTCVSRLRRTLPAGTILTDPAGYGIRIAPGDDLDAAEFARLVSAARAADDSEQARRDYRRALDLWRGPALVEIDSPGVRLAAAVLDEQLAVATEDWVDLELAAGHERDLLGELAGLVERFPLRERLRGQLMTSLHRSGRQADALAEYARARSVLHEELGIEPGAELQDLHRQLLAGTLPAADLGPARTDRVRCLPRTVADFTGRAEVVGRLLKAIEVAEPTGPAVVVIDGMAGSGKTTLALRLAALVGEAYPDAHLFVDLHGHSEEQPIEPAAALLVLLRQLGVDAGKVPADLTDRVGLWRTELARRRVLVVFDNAASSAQLADLLPTSPASVALVTSRRRLAGLDGVHPESLPMLDEDEAIELLARIAGDRVRAEPEAAAAVVRRCSGLALAIRLAGARLAHRPRWRVADLVGRLDGAVLPELAAEDRTLAGTFALSFEQLTVAQQRTFRLLGCYPGAEFDAPAVAALTGLHLHTARDLLDDLVDVHLVEEPEPDVYRLHDLLREFAVALAGLLPAVELRDAVVAVLDLQLHAAAAVVAGVPRQYLDRDLGARQPLRADLMPADPVARLERERPNLLAFVEAAAAAGRPDYAWQIPRAAWWFLFFRGYPADIAALCHRALEITEQSGDRAGSAIAANYLSSAYARMTDNAKARHYLELSIRLHEELGDWGSVAIATGNLAGLQFMSNQFAECVETSLATFRLGIRARQPDDLRRRLNNVATAYARLGRYPEALHYQRLNLFAASEQRDLHKIALCLVQIQSTRRESGAVRVETARRYLEVALRVFRRGSFPDGEAQALAGLANLLRAEGRFAEAVVEHRRVLDIVHRLADRRTTPEYLHDLGTTLLASGDLPAARQVFEESLRLSREVPLPYSVAQAETGLAECLVSTDPAGARRLLGRARVTFARLGTPERYQVERRLATLEGEVDQLRPAADGETMGG
ncbi:BTAD domain-containing putative transcriptional regulator [Micromonosporaceae bacterium Da 78-11]